VQSHALARAEVMERLSNVERQQQVDGNLEV
jgi:hypothetical protein